MSVVVFVTHLPSHSKLEWVALSPELPTKALNHSSGSRGVWDTPTHTADLPLPSLGAGPSRLPPSRARALGQPQAPFVPLMSLKCLAWAPASPAPTREKRTGKNRKKLTPAQLCCAPGGLAQGLPGTIPPGDLGPLHLSASSTSESFSKCRFLGTTTGLKAWG